VFLGYLVWIKRYFRAVAPEPAAAIDPPYVLPGSGSGS
jgi:hypothetical protein